MADIELVVKLPKKVYEQLVKYGEPLPCGNTFDDTIMKAVANGTILTPDMLADLLMEERIRGELKQDISYSKDIIDDVKCRLTVDIIDRRPCFCGAELREVWRESEE